MSWELALQIAFAAISAGFAVYIARMNPPPDPNPPSPNPPAPFPVPVPTPSPAPEIPAFVLELFRKAMADGKITIDEWIQIAMAGGAKLLEILKAKG